jgi:hypothetical protein
MKKFALFVLACLLASCAGGPKSPDSPAPEEPAVAEAAENQAEAALPAAEESAVSDELADELPLANAESPEEILKPEIVELPGESAGQEAAEFFDEAELAEQMEYAAHAERVETAESAGLPEPAAQAETAKPIEPAVTFQPARPVEPVRPTPPAAPTTPAKQESLKIAEPVKPTETAKPAEPIVTPPVITPAIREAPSAAVPGIVDAPVVFSRTVRAIAGQLVEVPFRGTGWVYLGELGSRRGISYNSRKLDTEGMSFIFQVEAPGTYALKFYKQDFIRNYILNDYVQVITGEAPEAPGAGWFNPPVDRGRVVAQPRWPATLAEAEISAGGKALSAGDSPAVDASAANVAAANAVGGAAASEVADKPPAPAIAEKATAPAQGNASPPAPQANAATAASAHSAAALGPDAPLHIFLQRAQAEYDAGRVASAISILDQLRELFPSGSDEAYWLLGQFYEANSPSRNILTSLDYYRRLIREFPQSGRCNDARRRIAYLERFYINIQ